MRDVIEDKLSVSMSHGGLGHMQNRWGFSYTQPTHTLKKTDKEEQTDFQQKLDELKKRIR
ncbi:winged helix-turn-helix domain-containing protein (plasmid) [Bacillus thuringiensis]|nr:winged helix-turn-helix domain-containing protein [Bacillus thuringiensis]